MSPLRLCLYRLFDLDFFFRLNPRLVGLRSGRTRILLRLFPIRFRVRFGGRSAFSRSDSVDFGSFSLIPYSVHVHLGRDMSLSVVACPSRPWRVPLGRCHGWPAVRWETISDED